MFSCERHFYIAVSLPFQDLLRKDEKGLHAEFKIESVSLDCLLGVLHARDDSKMENFSHVGGSPVVISESKNRCFPLASVVSAEEVGYFYLWLYSFELNHLSFLRRPLPP